MDYEMVLPAIAGASGIFAGVAIIYSKLRPRFPVKVNCWFCNTDTKVEFRYSEGWLCPSCEQYNGFTEEGDYNRDIPAQHCESLNYTLRAINKQRNKPPSLALGNGFCQTCNLNQTLKVRALADYTPIHPDSYDREIDEYRKRLERTYALCRQCEATLHQTLGKQDSWLKPKLISWRLKQSAENKSPIFSNTADNWRVVPFCLRVIRIFSMLISIAILLSSIHHVQIHSGVQLVSLDLGIKGEIYLTQIYKFLAPLIISGLAFVLLAIFGAGKDTLLVSDAVTSFVWVGLLALCSSKKLLPEEDYNSMQVLISAATVILTLWTLLVPRTLKSSRIVKPPLNKSMMSNSSSSQLNDSQCTLNASLSDDLKNITPPATPFSRDRSSTPIPHKGSRAKVDEDIDAGFESLKISTPYKNGQVHSNVSFSARSLFSDKPGYNPKLNDTYCIQRNVVSPSRLNSKTITQSSWVAGGYWGSPMSPREFAPHLGVPKPISAHLGQSTLFPLSRSSSQSSGYMSQNSGLPPHNGFSPCSLPNSRHGSVCGDFERGSVFSEPAYRTWVNPMLLNPSDSASQYSYSRDRVRSDAQSVHSCASVVSGSSLHKVSPSPSASTTCLFQDAHANFADNSNYSLRSRNFDKNVALQKQSGDLNKGNAKLHSTAGNRSPWCAFLLGMSIAANGFLVALLLWHSDLQSFAIK